MTNPSCLICRNNNNNNTNSCITTNNGGSLETKRIEFTTRYGNKHIVSGKVCKFHSEQMAPIEAKFNGSRTYCMHGNQIAKELTMIFLEELDMKDEAEILLKSSEDMFELCGHDGC